MEDVKTRPLYVLTRTSRRPHLFGRLRKSIAALKWPGGIIHVVHSDCSLDTYVDGNADVIVRGEDLRDIPIERRPGQYNLYNNRLLEVVRGLPPGWVHFIDDDDEYAAADVFERLLEEADDEPAIYVGRVHRGGKVYYPQGWGTQRTFQTEICVFPSEVALRGQWPATTGGDHHYTRQLSDRYPLRWVPDVLLVTTTVGKGRGNRKDLPLTDVNTVDPPKGEFFVKPLHKRGLGHYVDGRKASRLSKRWAVTFEGVDVEYRGVEEPDTLPDFDDYEDHRQRVLLDRKRMARGSHDVGVTTRRKPRLGVGGRNNRHPTSIERRHPGFRDATSPTG